MLLDNRKVSMFSFCYRSIYREITTAVRYHFRSQGCIWEIKGQYCRKPTQALASINMYSSNNAEKKIFLVKWPTYSALLTTYVCIYTQWVICMLEYTFQFLFHFIFYCDSVIVFICTIFNKAVRVQEFQAYAPKLPSQAQFVYKIDWLSCSPDFFADL